MDVKIELKENAVMPEYKHATDAGMDVVAAEDAIIAPGETKAIGTGIYVAVPEGYEMQVRPRSGISAKTHLRVANAPGTVDAGYRGEVKVLLHNTSPEFAWLDDKTIRRLKGDSDVLDINGLTVEGEHRNRGFYRIKKGDRIAQIVFCKVEHATLEIVPDITAIESDGRNDGGFGSTGIRA